MAGLGDQIMTLEGLGAAGPEESREHDPSDVVPVYANGVNAGVISDAHPGPRAPTSKELEQWRRALTTDWRLRGGDAGAFYALKVGRYDFRRYRDAEGKLVGKFYDERSNDLRIKRISDSPIEKAAKWMIDNCSWMAEGIKIVSAGAGEQVAKACATINAVRSGAPPEPVPDGTTIMGEVGVYPPGTVARRNVSRNVFSLYTPTLKQSLRIQAAAQANAAYAAAQTIARDMGPVVVRDPGLRGLGRLGALGAPVPADVLPEGMEKVGEEPTLPIGVKQVGEEKDRIAWYVWASGAAIVAILVWWWLNRRNA